MSLNQLLITAKGFVKKLYHWFPGKRVVFERLRTLGIPRSIYQYLTFKGVFSVSVAGSTFKLRHYGYQLENELFWDRAYETETLRVWADLCRKSSTIVDVGANTGLFALLAKSVNPKAQVIAFEPLEKIFAKLEANVQLNQFDIRCEKFALSNTNGPSEIYDMPFEHTYGASLNRKFNSAGRCAERIETMTLEEYWLRDPSLPLPDLIKIDVETHEPEVLEGMGKLLQASKASLIVEVLDDEVGDRLQSFLQPLRYSYFRIDEREGIKKVEAISSSLCGRNFLFRPPVC